MIIPITLESFTRSQTATKHFIEVYSPSFGHRPLVHVRDGPLPHLHNAVAALPLLHSKAARTVDDSFPSNRIFSVYGFVFTPLSLCNIKDLAS